VCVCVTYRGKLLVGQGLWYLLHIDDTGIRI